MREIRSVLVLAHAEGMNGTAVHQRSMARLFGLIPEYRFTVLKSPKDLKARRYDLYLNLMPPYDLRVGGESKRDFYGSTTDWWKNGVWLAAKKAYLLFPKQARQKLWALKQSWMARWVGVLPPPEEWITLCHDLAPLVCREWFPFPEDWQVDPLTNFSKSRHVIAVSENTKRDLVKHGVPEEKVSVVYNTTDEDFSSRNPCVPLPERDYLLVVGSFEPRKNAENVYAAFSRIRFDFPGKLVFVGGDRWGNRPVYDEIRRDPRCRIFENVSKEELVGWYRGAKALVYASWYEGFGLPVLEAAGCGIPVVCSANSGMLESGEGYAEFVDPADPADIARAMLKVTGPGYRVDAEARSRLLSKFSASENAKRLKAVVDGIAQREEASCLS